MVHNPKGITPWKEQDSLRRLAAYHPGLNLIMNIWFLTIESVSQKADFVVFSASKFVRENLTVVA
jgi:hypothetical protein